MARYIFIDAVTRTRWNFAHDRGCAKKSLQRDAIKLPGRYSKVQKKF